MRFKAPPERECEVGDHDCLFSISLSSLSNLQICIDSYALLTYDRSSFEQLKPENKTKIDSLEPEIRASV